MRTLLGILCCTLLSWATTASASERPVSLDTKTLEAFAIYNEKTPLPPAVMVSEPSKNEPKVMVYSSMATNVPVWDVNPLRAPFEGELAPWGIQIWGNHPALTVQRWTTEGNGRWETIGSFPKGWANINGYRRFDVGSVDNDDILRFVWDTPDTFLQEQVYRLMPTEDKMPVLEQPDDTVWRMPDGTFVLGHAKRIEPMETDCWDIVSPDWQGTGRGFGGRLIGISAMVTNSSACIFATSYRGETDLLITLEAYNVAHQRWDVLGEVNPADYRGTPSGNGAYGLRYGHYPLKSGSLLRFRFLNREDRTPIHPYEIATPLD